MFIFITEEKLPKSSDEFFKIKFDDEKLNNFRKKMSLPLPFKEYDQYGLRFELSHLQTLGINVVVCPINIAAEYHDLISKQYLDCEPGSIEYEHFLEIAYNDFSNILGDKSIDFNMILNSMNATSIGNMAYICLNCKDEKVTKIARDTYFKIFKIVCKQILTHQNIQKN